jgi:indole-3-glycerol phosphate synthase
MNILEKIIEYKKTAVAEAKLAKSIEQLKASALFGRRTISLKQFLLDDTKTGIIAEFKRQSPSKGIINANADVEAVTGAYAKFGASGLSVLTDEAFFGGSVADLLEARVNEIPILRKDFMIDEYQLVEAKSMGADVILLIAACLEPLRVKELATYAKVLGLEVLLEIHNEAELVHICDEVDLVGVNNRDLKTFTVDVQRSVELAEKIPGDKIKISESGISDATTIHLLKQHGYKGFLIGENFMKTDNPAATFEEFVEQLRREGES